ncbi:hmlalpha1p [Saccharomyces arboricola H-6]|uniref:Hmlalpha1p n=1 Tax=Saccharomyces arboricola (strain H-6 / AS 2.3317 / CBS 10644) TaxID=1160507 RepID=J8Q4D6_SACAR|nr:hmlalpha1p [Saccharomyces arboricola H-6]
MFTSKPAFRIKKTSKSHRNSTISKKVRDKSISKLVNPCCFNVIRPLKKNIQIPAPSPLFLKKIQLHRIESGSQNIHCRQVNKVSIKSSKKYLNSFMAFRAYYSQFGSGVKQNVLSSLLSEEWHADKMQHGIWDYFAQQYNFINPGFGFVEWLTNNYAEVRGDGYWEDVFVHLAL